MEQTKQNFEKFIKYNKFIEEFQPIFHKRCDEIKEYLLFDCVNDNKFDTGEYMMMESDLEEIREFGFFKFFDKSVREYDRIVGFPENDKYNDIDYNSVNVEFPTNWLWLSNKKIKEDFMKNYKKYFRAECFQK